MTHRAGADSGGTLCTSLATVGGGRRRRDGDADDVDDADRSRTALRFAGGDCVRSRPRRCRDGATVDGDGNLRFAGECSRPRGAPVDGDGDGVTDDAANGEDSDDGERLRGA